LLGAGKTLSEVGGDSMLRIGICTAFVDTSGEWPQLLELIGKWGFGEIELWDAGGELPQDAAGMALLKMLLQSNSIKALSVHGPAGSNADTCSPDKAIRERGIGNNLNSLEKAASLGAEFMVYHLSPGFDDESQRSERKKWAQDSLPRVIERAESLGVKLAVENLLLQHLGGTKEEFEELVGPFLKEGVGICIDTGHMQVSGLNMDVVNNWKEHIISFHIHDNDGSKDQHLPPGEGKVDWATLGRKLTEIDYCGPLMLECYFPRDGDTIRQSLRDLLEI
jgi:sugar phosphate isomerase/epimerase